MDLLYVGTNTNQLFVGGTHTATGKIAEDEYRSNSLGLLARARARERESARRGARLSLSGRSGIGVESRIFIVAIQLPPRFCS